MQRAPPVLSVRARRSRAWFGRAQLAALTLGSASDARVASAVDGPALAAPASADAFVATTTGTGPTIAQLIGQKLVVRMDGRTPSADLLGRIRRGEIGGVVLFGANITTATALRALTASSVPPLRPAAAPDS